MTQFRAAAALVLLFGASCASAQSPRTEHTLKLDEGQVSPEASIGDIAWLAGFWAGEGFGGQVEETWNAPSVGTMVGTFKLMHGDAPTMYEIELITEEAGSLVLKVKHFEPDFAAWEEKTEFTAFRLVKMTEDAAYFEGLTIRRDGPDQITMFLVLKHEGEVSEEQFTYHRVGSH